MSEFEGIVELVEAGSYSGANHFLDHGYKLLAIQSVALSRTHQETRVRYVMRRAAFILGRTADVEHRDQATYIPRTQRVPDDEGAPASGDGERIG